MVNLAAKCMAGKQGLKATLILRSLSIRLSKSYNENKGNKSIVARPSYRFRPPIFLAFFLKE
jgi:hypothetical protein